jgi:hypothetical protein
MKDVLQVMARKRAKERMDVIGHDDGIASEHAETMKMRERIHHDLAACLVLEQAFAEARIQARFQTPPQPPGQTEEFSGGKAAAGFFPRGDPELAKGPVTFIAQFVQTGARQ